MARSLATAEHKIAHSIFNAIHFAMALMSLSFVQAFAQLSQAVTHCQQASIQD